MTLITNVIRERFVLMAGDRLTIRADGTPGPKQKKIFSGKNYCIGIHGTLEANGFSAIENVAKMIMTNQYINPSKVTPSVLYKLFVPSNYDSSYQGLRLTISGLDQDRLFSFYYCTCCNQLTDLMVADKQNIRFNQFNTKDYDLFNLAIYGGEDNIHKIENPTALFDSLKNVYTRISQQMNDIGELKDCCAIFQDRIEWLTT